MAVVQISKIQVRRGLKNSGIGVPQLSSAEFAWAVDSQELFIGNGSVAEGAPFVGNTKILTEHDNILELASSYRFSEPDNTIFSSVERTLQAKLDEYVSVLDFGAVGDGITDNVQAFHNAFEDLFKYRSTTTRYKKVLVIPNGTYKFSNNLKIPSTAKIIGETQSGVILKIDSNSILFTTEDGIDTPSSFNSTNRPRDVIISNLTIEHSSGQTVITGLGDSVFDKVKFKSDYILGSSVSPVSEHPASLSWENTLPGTKVDNITIRDCHFESTALAIRSDQITVDSSNPPVYDTFIKIDNCKFFVCDTAILINGIQSQGNKWRISDCLFEEIANQAFVSDYGRGTIIQRCHFLNCGNNTNTAEFPTTNIVSFGEKFGNIVVSCSSNRHQLAGVTSQSSIDAISEVSNSSRTELVDLNYSDISLSDSFRPLAVFSAFNRYTYIDYTLCLGVHTRKGQLTISVDSDLDEVSLTDNYSYSPSSISSVGGITVTNLQFKVEFKDNDLDSGTETILLSYMNPLASGVTGNITYSVSYGV